MTDLEITKFQWTNKLSLGYSFLGLGLTLKSHSSTKYNSPGARSFGCFSVCSIDDVRFVNDKSDIFWTECLWFYMNIYYLQINLLHRRHKLCSISIIVFKYYCEGGHYFNYSRLNKQWRDGVPGGTAEWANYLQSVTRPGPASEQKKLWREISFPNFAFVPRLKGTNGPLWFVAKLHLIAILF